MFCCDMLCIVMLCYIMLLLGAAVAKHQTTSFVSWDSPRDAAHAIIIGTARRAREIYHPFTQLYPVAALYSFVPDWIEALLVGVLR